MSVATTVALGLGLLLVAGAAAGQQDRRRALEELQARLEEARSELREASAQADDVVGRVATLRSQLEVQRLQVEEAQQALAIAMEEVGRSERTLHALEQERAELRERIRARTGALYRMGRWGYLRMLFSISRGEEALPGIRLLRAVVRRDAEVLDALERNRELSRETAAGLRSQQAEARSWLERQRSRTAELEERRRREQRALDELGNRRRRIADEVAEMEGRHDRLDRLLGILGAEGEGGLGGLPIEEFRGALDWPVAGAVAREFGPYRDAQYGTLVPHNGVLVRPDGPDQVKVVYPGRVVYSGSLRGVGVVTVVQHSRNALTLYSGIRELQAREGDILAFGDQLGVSDGEVYFEIRVDNEPEDPRRWLR